MTDDRRLKGEMEEGSPARMILARAEAFRHCDFGFIFDSYHDSSNFRRQFPDREDYVRYGWANLAKEFRILDCVIIRELVEGDTARVIFVMTIELHGDRQFYAELAWLKNAGAGWRYRRGQKLSEDELPVPIARLDFHHFDAVIDKVLY
jgi:SEC-C motif-containing protein